MVCQESSDDKKKKPEKFDGAVIKSINSGGDSMTARRLRENPVTFRNQASLLICANDIPPIEPKDAEQTLHEIRTNTIFLKPDEISRRSDTEKRVYKFLEKIPAIKAHFITTPECKEGIIHILFNAFYLDIEKPKQINISEDIDEFECDPVLTELLQIIEYTGNQDHSVTSKEITDKMEIKVHPRKIKALITQMGGIYSNTKSGSFYKAIRILENSKLLDYDMSDAAGAD